MFSPQIEHLMSSKTTAAILIFSAFAMGAFVLASPAPQLDPTESRQESDEELTRNCWDRPSTNRLNESEAKARNDLLVKPAKGTVSALSEDDVTILTIDLGSEVGIEVGDNLRIFRAANNMIALAKVTEVTASESMVEIKGSVGIEVGDVVLKDTTLDLVGILNQQNGSIETGNLAQSHFEADSNLGIKRMLIYGKTAAGVGLDKATGLQTVMAGGCCVSGPMMDFIKEYNQLMKQSVNQVDKDNN